MFYSITNYNKYGLHNQNANKNYQYRFDRFFSLHRVWNDCCLNCWDWAKSFEHVLGERMDIALHLSSMYEERSPVNKIGVNLFVKVEVILTLAP